MPLAYRADLVFATYLTRSVVPTEELGMTPWDNAIGVAGILVDLGGPVPGAVADQGTAASPNTRR
jgi:hypothetical protein